MQLEAVTIDAYGTLVTLRDPVPALRAALAERGVERSDDDVRSAFDAEVAFYRAHSHEGRDEATLAVAAPRLRPRLPRGGRGRARPRRLRGCVHFVARRSRSCPAHEPRAASSRRPGCGSPSSRTGMSGCTSILARARARRVRRRRRHLRRSGSAEACTGSVRARARAARRGRRRASGARRRRRRGRRKGARAAGMRFEPAPLADAARRILA